MRISFDSAAEFYDETRGPPKSVMDQLVKTLMDELDGYKTVLDAGVGTGRFAKPLQDNGFKVVGVDIAKRMIEKAAGKGVTNMICGDVCFLPFKEDSFDVAVCVHILHLIREWKMALQEVCRVTTKAMISIDYMRKNPVREAYNSILKKYGYESRRLGKGERELKNLVKPKSVPVASYETSADERLNHLGQRAYSSQWEIPEDVNRKVVSELKKQFWGRKFPQELHLLVWNVRDLEAYCGTFKSALS
ncbi:MAG: class I SAM-dependent methyltransferase [Candidatus Bathyarchaeota archaeon]|nr:class I SAM-dependent methyltransferase [Candidatus Bathyarchaeota archaeon]MDH5787485.1 class I SAM-dependent methyltransferase [Candidatus Bathyarchaeota archaeon]